MACQMETIGLGLCDFCVLVAIVIALRPLREMVFFRLMNVKKFLLIAIKSK